MATPQFDGVNIATVLGPFLEKSIPAAAYLGHDTSVAHKNAPMLIVVRADRGSRNCRGLGQHRQCSPRARKLHGRGRCRPEIFAEAALGGAGEEAEGGVD